MAATKLQLNWSAVGYTPSGGSLTAITKVKSVNIDTGGNLIEFSGDNDRFPTVIVNDYNTPKATLTSGDVANLLALAPGTIGIFTATHADAKAAAGGAIVYTLINAVIETTTSQGPHRQFGEGTLNMRAFSSDGTTNPLSFTRV